MEIEDKSSMLTALLLSLVIVMLYAGITQMQLEKMTEKNIALENKAKSSASKLLVLREDHNDVVKTLKSDQIELVNELKAIENDKIALIAELEAEKNQKADLTREVKRLKTTRGSNTAISSTRLVEATAYDLSVQSCGKAIGHSSYGITASGYNLSGHTWDSARVVAADPKVYPLGTKLKLTFVDDSMSKYNGVYTVRDVGGAIKGNRIDFFMGDFQNNKTHQSVWDFGRRKVNVVVVK